MISFCGNKKTMDIEDRIYECKCGASIDRDLNAALNLKQYAIEHLSSNI